MVNVGLEIQMAEGEAANILLISPTSVGIGGVAQHVSKLREKLENRGYNVKVVSSSNTIILKKKGLMNPSFTVSASFKTLLRKYDIIHAHNLPSSIPMRLSIGRKILTLHGFYSEQIKIIHGSTVGKIASWFEKRALRWPDVVTTVSKRDAEKYRQYGLEVVHIPNAVDLSDMPQSEKRLSNNPQVIYVGRLSREKGLEYLIKAIRILYEKRIYVDLVIVGDGPERDRIKYLADGLDNVHLLGALNHDETLKYIRGAEMLVIPSIVEGISTSILEAMALRTPVIATNVGGTTEIIQHMKNGILIQPRKPEQIADAITTILTDEQTRRHIIEEAYKTILHEYNWDTVINSYLRIYNL